MTQPIPEPGKADAEILVLEYARLSMEEQYRSVLEHRGLGGPDAPPLKTRLHYFKCLACGLHFTVLSWYELAPIASTFTLMIAANHDICISIERIAVPRSGLIQTQLWEKIMAIAGESYVI